MERQRKTATNNIFLLLGLQNKGSALVFQWNRLPLSKRRKDDCPNSRNTFPLGAINRNEQTVQEGPNQEL